MPDPIMLYDDPYARAAGRLDVGSSSIDPMFHDSLENCITEYLRCYEAAQAANRELQHARDNMAEVNRIILSKR